jgi:hypothetical protein
MGGVETPVLEPPDSLSSRASTPNFWWKRRSSPGEAAFSFRSTKWILTRRSLKKRCAFRFRRTFAVPKIWTWSTFSVMALRSTGG